MKRATLLNGIGALLIIVILFPVQMFAQKDLQTTKKNAYKFTFNKPENCYFIECYRSSDFANVESGDLIEEGDTIYFTPFIDEGYKIDKISFDKKDIEGEFSAYQEAKTYTLKMPNHDASVEFNVKKAITYELTFQRDNANGVVNVYNLSNQGKIIYEGQKAEELSGIQIWATPDKGSEVVSISVNGQNLKISGQNNPSGLRQAYFELKEDSKIEVKFSEPKKELKYFTIDFNRPSHCQLEAIQIPLGDRIFPKSQVKEGRIVSFKVKLDQGYYLKSVTNNGTIISSRGNEKERYISLTVTENININFDVQKGKMEPHKIKFKNDYENGIVTVFTQGDKELQQIKTDSEFLEGSRLIVLATPDKGSQVERITLNGKDLDLQQQKESTNPEERIAVIDMPSEEATIDVTFTNPTVEVKKYTVNYQIVGDGKVALIDSYTQNNIKSGANYKEGRSLTLLVEKNKDTDEVNVLFNNSPIKMAPFKDKKNLYYFIFTLTEDTNIYVNISLLGIDKISKEPIISINKEEQSIEITSKKNQKYAIYAMNGTLISEGILQEGKNKITLDKGIFLIKTANQVFKVII